MNLARTTARVSGITFGGYAIGLVVQILFAGAFGARGQADAWFAAVAVPNFVAIVLFASLAKACLPVFVSRREKVGPLAFRTLSGVANLTFLGLLLLSAAVVLAADPVARLLFPSFGPDRFPLARLLLRVSILSVPAVGTSLVLSAWLHSERRYAVPALSAALPPLSVLLSLVALRSHFPEGQEVACMAVGLVAGSWLQLLSLSLVLLRPGRHHLTLALTDPGVRKVRRTLAPLLAAAALIALYPLLEKRFASGLPEGAVAWLAFGRRPLNLLLILVAVPAATISYTEFAKAAARGDLPALRRRAWRTVIVTLLVLLPASLFFAVHAEEILRIIYERGRFSPADTRAAATALRLLLPVILLASTGKILVHALLARGKPAAPLAAALAGIAVYVALGPLAADRHGFQGLAVLMGIGFAVTVLLIVLLLLRDLGRPRKEGVVRSLLEIALAGALSLGCLLATRGLVPGARESLASRLLVLAAVGLCAAGVYLGALALARNRHLARLLRELFSPGPGAG